MIEIIRAKGISFFAKRLSNKILDKLSDYLQARKDKNNCTYTNKEIDFSKIYPIYDATKIQMNQFDADLIIRAADEICKHKFNLLGSGLQLVDYNAEYPGFESNKYNHIINFDSIDDLLQSQINSSNFHYSKEVAKNISLNYRPIDWQRDFRSGYRWDSKTYHSKISYGNIPGVDVKLPWELGRLSHLQLLVYAWKISGNKKYIDEYFNQLNDFIAFNPPKYGIQWKTTMDVALRAINIVSTISLIDTSVFMIPKDAQRIYINYLYDHLEFILNNLEWSSGMRANHYLANLCGIIYLSSFLPINESVSFSFSFSVNELILESYWQFNDDGGNFEASLPYHNFASEMLFQTLFMIKNINKARLIELARFPKFQKTNNYKFHKDLLNRIENQHLNLINSGLIDFPTSFNEKLDKIAHFTLNTLRNDNFDFQIGDNDNGYFFRFIPYINDDLSIQANNRTELAKILCYHTGINIQLSGVFYQEFGVYIFRNTNYEICVKCGSNGQNGKGGHSHNDNLSFELFVENNLLICDAGTYTYTASPELRNVFRSTHYHNTLIIDNAEQNPISKSKGNLFWLPDNSNAKCLNYNSTTFTGEHYGFSTPHKRTFEFKDNEIKITDFIESNSKKSIYIHFTHQAKLKQTKTNSIEVYINSKVFIINANECKINFMKYDYSPTYGVKYSAPVIVLETENNQIFWNILTKA